MFSYKSSTEERRPVSEQWRQESAKALRYPAYASYSQNHADVFDALRSNAGARLRAESEKADADYSLAHQQAQRQLVLSGLAQLGEAQQNQNSLANTRLQNMVGFAGNILGDLFN